MTKKTVLPTQPNQPDLLDKTRKNPTYPWASWCFFRDTRQESCTATSLCSRLVVYSLSNGVEIPVDCTKVTCRCCYQQQVWDLTSPDSWPSWSGSNNWDDFGCAIIGIRLVESFGYWAKPIAWIYKETKETRGPTYNLVIPVPFGLLIAWTPK
jgi:hypothetical protein